ncbi:phage shock protein C (PspC) family protein [Nocardia mexicana]|uniref:Phage shock protein C (PspC) family protein n=2 Tax=Nocardia mexicana TaxID=279262 RepID=A0A370H633_9NOCA|nr:phage shock protein C (PspC) family protein [Nocardia mexicana]
MEPMTRASGWAGGTGRTGFSDQLHHLWRTRPVRLPRQGPIAGVAAGFGHRYNVDPVLVRVAFVVSSLFGGAGIVLYLAAWLLLPAAGDQVSATEGLFGKGHSSQSPTKTVVLIVALAIAVTTMGPVGVGLGGSGLISFVLMLAGWWLLYLRQTEPPADGSGPLLADGGIASTGYPGTMYPGGSPWAGPMYGPYTTLPDHYEPDPIKDAAAPGNSATDVIPRDGDTAVLRADAPTETVDTDAARGNSASDTAAVTQDGDTAVLRTDAPTETVDTGAGQAASAGDTDAVPQDSAVGTESSGTEVMPGKDRPSADGPAGPTGKAEGAQPRATRTAEYPRPAAGPVRPGPTPPGWDPLGVAPMSWDLPDPTPHRPVAVQAPPPKRPRSRLTPMVIGLALLAAAAAAAVAAAGVDWMTPGRIGAVALAVVGLGLLLGAFLRRGYGLMVVLAPLAGFVILASMVGPVEFDRGAMGDHVWTPTTVAALEPEYRVNMGSGTLDLRSLALTENKTVNVSVRMGEFRVLVPDSMRLQANCTSNLGDVQCPEGLTGPADGPVLTLDVDVQAGDAEVKRG